MTQSQDIRALVERLRSLAGMEAEVLTDGFRLTQLCLAANRAADALSCLAGEGWRPKVKPLEWVLVPEGKYIGITYKADTVFGEYIAQEGRGYFDNTPLSTSGNDINAGMNAAFAHYERLSLSALDLPAPSVEEKLP